MTGVILLDLSKVEPMIALPFHPSNAYSIRELQENTADILAAVDAESESCSAAPRLLSACGRRLRTAGCG